MFKLDLEKAENQRSNCQHPLDHRKRKFQKNIYFCIIDYAKAFDCVDHDKLGKFWKTWEYHTTWPASWETCTQVKKQQLKLDMEWQTDSKLGKQFPLTYIPNIRQGYISSSCLFNL